MVASLNISKLFLFNIEKNSHRPFWIVLNHDMWHNKSLPHGVLIVSILKANYLVTRDTFK